MRRETRLRDRTRPALSAVDLRITDYSKATPYGALHVCNLLTRSRDPPSPAYMYCNIE